MTVDEKTSEIVQRYIAFDDRQQHLHSWHCLQDCLEVLRKWEAENDAALASAREEIERLKGELSDAHDDINSLKGTIENLEHRHD